MSVAPMRASGRAAELRWAFDRAFSEPIKPDATVEVDLLAIRVGAEPCAIRLAEISGLFVDKKITPVPGGGSALLGIAGFRGVILPVFNLQILLGYSGAAAPRWLVIAAGAPVALAFDAFENRLRVLPEAIRPKPDAQTLNFARELVRTPQQFCPLIHLPSILGAIKSQKLGTAPLEER